MTELELKYGCNPNQKSARITMVHGNLPLEVLNGKPGYINFMDALNSWQLVKALKNATGLPAAASFKHVSPAGAALGLPLSDVDRRVFFAPAGDLSPIACAYIRARGADRLCSFGDWAALSDVCDEDTARFLALEVSDGIIAPDYTKGALSILKTKRKGAYNVVRIDPDYEPESIERRTIYGITFEQEYNNLTISADMLEHIVTRNHDLTPEVKRDMLLSLITLKYTQSNSVCYVKDGQTIGVGAGQQSRIHCTRLAGDKADTWWLRRHPYVLDLQFADDVRRPDRDNAIDQYIHSNSLMLDMDMQKRFKTPPLMFSSIDREDWISKRLSGVTLGSDAFFPFGDNVERAAQSGVQYIVQPGGSIRDEQVIAAADSHNMVMAFTGARLFHH